MATKFSWGNLNFKIKYARKQTAQTQRVSGYKISESDTAFEKKLTEAVENDFAVSCLAPKTHPGLEFF